MFKCSLRKGLLSSQNTDRKESRMVRVISYYLLLLVVLVVYGGQV